ncbi:MAG: glycosyltransferase family 4 protein [Acidiferrobacterales bacterium]
MPIKVTHVMLSRGFGGGERLFVDLCLALAQHGVQVQAIHNCDFVRRSTFDNIPGLSAVPISMWGGWDPFARAQIVRAINAYRPDLIHSHFARGASVAGTAARRMDIPVAANLHNYAALKYYRNINMFVPSTEDQKRYLMNNGVASRNIRIIPHFSRMEPVNQRVLERLPAAVFVSYGRFVRKKGFDVLLHAVRQLADHSQDIRLMLGGDGPERANLEALARSLDLGTRVEFSGWIDDVAAFLARGSFFVLPSIDEPFGIAVLEAMASGRTIITTNSKGPLEVLDEDTAYFVEIGNADSLARGMRSALDDTPLSLSRARAALTRYADRYHAEVVIPQFLSLYEDLRAATSLK